MQIVRKDANCRQQLVDCCDNCGKITEGFHTCTPNPVIEQLRDENARLKEKLADTRRHYEELRKLIDGNSESMTHKDAVRELELMVSQQQSEPVAVVKGNVEITDNGCWTVIDVGLPIGTKLYLSSPAQSESERDAAYWYKVGFMASGEGWNGEYPFGDRCEDPESNIEWVKIRDAAMQEGKK